MKTFRLNYGEEGVVVKAKANWKETFESEKRSQYWIEKLAVEFLYLKFEFNLSLIIFVYTVEWIEEYQQNYVDEKQLKKDIDEFMQHYDEDQARVKFHFLWVIILNGQIKWLCILIERQRGNGQIESAGWGRLDWSVEQESQSILQFDREKHWKDEVQAKKETTTNGSNLFFIF